MSSTSARSRTAARGPWRFCSPRSGGAARPGGPRSAGALDQSHARALPRRSAGDGRGCLRIRSRAALRLGARSRGGLNGRHGRLIAAALAEGARTVVVAAGGSAATDGGRARSARSRPQGTARRRADRARRCEHAVRARSRGVRATEGRGSECGGASDGAPATAGRGAAARPARRSDERRCRRLSGGLWACYGATIVPGARWILDAIAFDERLARAAAVITGEGRIDSTTLEGKAVFEIAARCTRAGVPVHAVVGSSALSPAECAQLSLASIREASSTLTSKPPGVHSPHDSTQVRRRSGSASRSEREIPGASDEPMENPVDGADDDRRQHRPPEASDRELGNDPVRQVEHEHVDEQVEDAERDDDERDERIVRTGFRKKFASVNTKPAPNSAHQSLP